MFIVSKDREIVVNVDNVTNVFMQNGNRIIARTVDSEEVLLGLYVRGGAKDVFEDMLKKVFPPDTLIFKNCMLDDESLHNLKDKVDLNAILVSDSTAVAEVKMYECGVYYMPEE